MKTKEALSIVFGLAKSANVSNLEEEFKNDPELKKQYQKQQQALNIVRNLIIEFPILSNECYVSEKIASKLHRIFYS